MLFRLSFVLFSFFHTRNDIIFIVYHTEERERERERERDAPSHPLFWYIFDDATNGVETNLTPLIEPCELRESVRVCV